MWARQRKLRRLREELQIIIVFERLEKYATGLQQQGNHDEHSDQRENRRSRILAEIAALENAKPSLPQRYAATASMLLLVSTTAYFYYLLR